MGLLDKLIDKIFDSIKKNKTNVMVNKLKKNNPTLAKAAEDHKQSYDDFKDELEKAIRDLKASK